MTLHLTCLDCGKSLPPDTAGKCRECASGRGTAGLPIAPHCARCHTAFQFDPKGPMAQFNAKCKCPGGKP